MRPAGELLPSEEAQHRQKVIEAMRKLWANDNLRTRETDRRYMPTIYGTDLSGMTESMAIPPTK